VRKRLASGAEVLGGDEFLVSLEATQGFDLLRRPVRKVGQGAVARLATLAPALAKEEGGRGVAVGDGFNVNGPYYA
jgi:hypothetical protein